MDRGEFGLGYRGHEEAAKLGSLGLSTSETSCCAGGEGLSVVAKSYRQFYPGSTRARESEALARGRSLHAAPPRQLGSYRAAALSRRDSEFCAGPVAERI